MYWPGSGYSEGSDRTFKALSSFKYQVLHFKDEIYFSRGSDLDLDSLAGRIRGFILGRIRLISTWIRNPASVVSSTAPY